MKNFKDNLKQIIVGIIIVVGVTGLLLLILSLFNGKDNNVIDKKNEYVAKETVDVLVAKFNTEVMDNGMEYPASEDYLTEEDDFYWYGLYDDVFLHIVPVKYTGDLKQDIVLEMGIFYDKGSENEKMAMDYLFHLIKANNNNLSDSDVNKIIDKAKELGKDNINAEEGTGYYTNGLLVTYWDNEDNYHYSVSREMES